MSDGGNFPVELSLSDPGVLTEELSPTDLGVLSVEKNKYRPEDIEDI